MQNEEQAAAQQLQTAGALLVQPSILSASCCSDQHPSESFASADMDMLDTSTQTPSSPSLPSVTSSPRTPCFSPIGASPSSMEMCPDDADISPHHPLPGRLAPASSSPTTQDDLHTACIGFKLVGDNIDKTVKPRYMTSERQTQSLHYFHSYAVRDRVDCSNLSDSPPSTTCPPIDELCQKLLPSKNDTEALNTNFATHVARILINNLPAMKFAFDDVVDWHIIHQYYAEMGKKSEVVRKRTIILNVICIIIIHPWR